MDIPLIRKNYPITQNDIYLNHAATAPISNHSIERMMQLATEMQRPLSEHFYPWLGILEDTRRRLAELINAHPSEIAFCQNTSTGLSLIANAIPFQANDCILVPRNEFPSNIYIWQNLQQKGMRFAFFDVEAGVPVVETLKKLDLKGVRLLSISAVSYYTGRLYELKEIADFCRERNILICYDAIQGLGVIPFDVQAIQPDFVAAGAQKWLLGSVGCGFIYARKQWLEKLTVPLVGWTSVKYPEDFSLKQLDFATDMTRFEPGLPDILPIAALNASLRDLAVLGWEHIYARIKANTTYLTRALNVSGIKTLAEQDQTAGIVSFNVPDSTDFNALLTTLVKNKIHITQREHYVRVSPHFYNTHKELDAFLTAFAVKSTQPIPNITKINSKITDIKSILLTGATGILGKAFANELAKQGYNLTLVGRDTGKLHALNNELQQNYKLTVHIEIVDFNNTNSFDDFLLRLKTSTTKYDALINCAGIAETDEVIHLSVDHLKSMLQVNCVAAFQLMRLFLTDLKTPQPLGILNIVSATGRCGWPLLSGYAASNAALWSLSEVLSRELSNNNLLTATTYVAPPMHSRMQKRLGRAALRYFKLSGDFPYKHAPQVAKEAWGALIEKKPLLISKYNRWMLLLNAFMPGLINKRVKKIWKM